jgi:ABC-type transporter Mla subunit MlaD
MVDANSQTLASEVKEVVDLTSLIKRYLVDIEKLKQELKTQNEMFNDAINNDKNYSEHNQQVKNWLKKRNAVKQTLIKQPAVEAIVAKQKELKVQIKDFQDALSRYLERYYQVAKTNILEGDDGDLREIIPVYKLVKKKG